MLSTHRFLLLLLSIFLFSQHAIAQDVPSSYHFDQINEAGCSSVKHQGNTGTCWCFSGSSFLESEVMRLHGRKIDLSEMYSVRSTYIKKADIYMRRHGKIQFSQGGLGHDVLFALQEKGAMPESLYQGGANTDGDYSHKALFKSIDKILKKALKKKGSTLGQAWKKSVLRLLDQQMGKVAQTFSYEGKEYTPKSFADEIVKINMNDYVSLTSYTHHPFYSQFVLEIPDNFSNGSYYNLPLNELQLVADNALANGFTIEWDGDVSEKGFSSSKGLAIVTADNNYDSSFIKPMPENQINQEIRQKDFDSYQITDDHLMHITGVAQDQNGTVYYITKNSWGADKGPFKGYIYMSESYFRLATVSILVHKNAIPKEVRTKLGF